MLIADAIQNLCDEERLFRFDSLEWRQKEVRRIHVSSDLHQFLTTRSRDAGANRDRAKLQALFDAFVAGKYISATLEADVMGTDMKRLSPGSDEVWEFKIGKRKFVQFRVFGRFAEFNHFIALTGPVDRSRIDDGAEIIRCQDVWRTLFKDLRPHYGSQLDDYFSSAPVSLSNP